jgi:acyl-coenzyme A synthetase/AMP-(fatty) acid ligase
VVGYPHDIKGQGIYAYVTLMQGEEPSDAVDDVVDPAGDPVIAVRVAPAAVAREVAAREGREVGPIRTTSRARASTPTSP